MNRRKIIAVAATLCALAGPVAAQDWPTARPVRVVVAYPAGGPTDLVARLLCNELQAQLGGNFIVDNRAGAGGTIGTGHVAKAPADGYTLILTSTVAQSINTTLLPNVPYDPVKDFTHVSLVSQGPVAILVSANSPWTSFNDLVAAARANPKSISYGSALGSVGHLTGELAKRKVPFQMQHVPYKGGAPALADLVGGQIQVMTDVLATHAEMIKGNRVRALALAAGERSDLIPEVPTFAELGYKDLVAYSWFGVSGPAQLPQPIVDRLDAAIQKVLVKTEFRQKVKQLGMDVTPGYGPHRYTGFVAEEVQKWGAVIRGANIKPE
ncbi:Bug family tripartite tricarboxylate transporter substrate binding protein [Ramlibacter sp.]|uniref:Bug family tripartite tricarboxylate transporter substrate binding protein n=1 Tax=Ramlibacter sp. TaxID=1917967 RepID=UPI002FCBC644